MARRKRYDVVHRWEGGPIITIEDLPFKAADIRNAAAVKLGDKYILLVTIERLNGTSVIHCATSDDGYHFEVDVEPFICPDPQGKFVEYEDRGVFDPRIVKLEDFYYITYNVLGRHGFLIMLARTRDFKDLEHIGMISQPDTKATALFPEKIKGKYARLERPGEGRSIWLSYSDDFIYWGGSEVVMTPRAGFWDWHHIGVSTPPTRVADGWLIVYYGVKITSAGPLYRLGAAILDQRNPAKVVGRTNIPILTPRMDYERIGDIPNLVFSCGKIIEGGDEVKLYYGAANSCICVGTTKIENIVSACLESAREF